MDEYGLSEVGSPTEALLIFLKNLQTVRRYVTLVQN